MGVEAWIGLGALIASIIVPTWLHHQRGRKAQIEIRVLSYPVLVNHELPADLTVTCGDQVLDQPYMTIFYLRNRGPRDITSSMFDDGQPIWFAINQKVYGLGAYQSEGAVKIRPGTEEEGDAEAVVEVFPGLLRREAEWWFGVLLSGPAKNWGYGEQLLETNVEVAHPIVMVPEQLISFARARRDWPKPKRSPGSA